QLSNSTSASRDALGSDTDNNAADFTVGTPTPTNSANDSEGGGSTDPEEPQPPVNPTEVIAIADIQGTGATSPHEGRTVTTQGEVTAVYAEGGLNGFVIQSPGTRAQVPSTSDASHGIFIYMNNRPAAQNPVLGKVLTVTGDAGEHFEPTQLTNPTFRSEEHTSEHQSSFD